MKTFQLGIFAAVALCATTASAQASGECLSEVCGTPEQTGGGCGCGCGCSILIAFTDQGDTYQYADDYDDDGIEDDMDNCPFSFNPDQGDDDGDLRGDGCDNCPAAANFDLRDSDADGLGDACDNDDDNDVLFDPDDNCFTVPNPQQTNTDGDLFGDACDIDDDEDGCDDAVDNCPLLPGANCLESGAIVPSECFLDEDADDIPDSLDLCPGVVSQGNLDGDGDGMGDPCDPDLDNDTVDNTFDNCIQLPNGDQKDVDKDGLGDPCDPRLCYVITDEESCLDPTGPFAVHAGKTIKTQTGDDVLLHLFANRESTSIRYTWTITKMPEDGDAKVQNPKGAVSVSNSVQYIYTEEDRQPRFSARVPGTYELELLAELNFEDEAYPAQKTSKSKVTINVGGEALPQWACGSAPGSTAAVVALLGLLAVPALRRRKR